jgi:5-(carboxyamino)imidazole ribonucleotide synthase
MWAADAVRMGYRVAILEPDAQAPAAAFAHRHLVAAYDDPAALDELAGVCAAVTTEFENVPAPALARLAGRTTVAPAASAVAVAQDRVAEKRFIAGSGVPVAPHAVIEAEADWTQADSSLFPAILKTARLGYDGKGQARVANLAEAQAAWRAMQGVPCVLEKLLELSFEISVVLARGADGASVAYPPVRNLHRSGILAVSEWPAPGVGDDLAAQATQAARQVADALGYVGVMCVEFFVLKDGRLVANEMAPRPHNSGHWTIDACDVNQFELQVRAMAGLPMPAPRPHSAAVMLNLLGDVWPGMGTPHGREPLDQPDWPAVLALPGAALHLYGKAQARAGRKMGHLTLTAATPEAARATALQAAAILGISPF